MSDTFDENIKTIMDALIDGMTKETIDKNKDTIERLIPIVKDRYFFDKLEYARHEFYTMLERIINVPEQENMYILEHILSGLYDHFFYKLMNKIEGISCCADKSSYITNMTLRALKENKNLSLYQDYNGFDCVEEERKNKQAYWSPATIKDTDTAMKLFWDWYLLRGDE